MADNSSPDTLHCSFCGKDQHEVRKLIAGPNVFICVECVGLCTSIIEQELAAPQGQGQLSAEEIADAARQQREAEEREKALRKKTPRLLESLRDWSGVMGHARNEISETIGILRERGVSDDEIQRWLNITPEIAIELYLGPATVGARAGSGRHGTTPKAADPEGAARPDAQDDEA